MSDEVTLNRRQRAAAELEQRRDQISELLAEYGQTQEATPDAWSGLAEKLGQAYADLKAACEDRARKINPGGHHADALLGELKHEKGLAYLAWQEALKKRDAAAKAAEKEAPAPKAKRGKS